MDERDFLAEQFEEHRTHLRAMAHRMLGSISEADDALREAWLRLSRSDTSGVENLGGWLTTVVVSAPIFIYRRRGDRSHGVFLTKSRMARAAAGPWRSARPAPSQRATRRDQEALEGSCRKPRRR
jgi:DNA-directed RNA polymerase specialized sigma24 family protein